MPKETVVCKAIPNKITRYFHCGRCIEEKPIGISARDWAYLELGLTASGEIQVWCARHDCNIALIDKTMLEKLTASMPACALCDSKPPTAAPPNPAANPT